MNIAILLPHISYPLGKTLLDGVRASAESRGDKLVCFLGDYITTPEGCNIHELVISKNIDGLLIYGGGLGQFIVESEVRSFLNHFSSKPLVNIGYRAEGFHNVNIDNFNGMHDIVLHLIVHHGHTRIAFVNGPESHPEALARFQGYREALKSCEIPYDENLVIPGDFSPESGRKATIKLIKLLKKQSITAVAFSCDTMASAAMAELTNQGISFPEDLAVTGFDNSDDATSIQPGLSTVDQNAHKLGQEAYSDLISLIEGRKIQSDTILRAKSVFRGSCGCFPDVLLNVSTESQKLSRQKIPLHAEFMPPEDSHEYNYLLSLLNSDLADSTDHEFVSHLLSYKPLKKLFREQVYRGISMRNLQDFISMHRQSLLSSLTCEEQKRFEKIWHQMRVFVHMQVESSLTSRRVLADSQMRSMSIMSNKMIGAGSFNQLKDLLDEELINFKVEECGVILKKITHGENKFSLEYFFSREETEIKLPVEYDPVELLPGELAHYWSGGILLFRPLLTVDHISGFMFFTLKKELSVSDGVFIDALTSQVASSMTQIKLLEERNRVVEELQLAYQGLEKANTKLEDLSYRDELTGMYNRRGFMDLASTLLENCRHNHEDFLLIFGDLDGLKGINDKYGHDQGDYAILSVGKIVQAACRDSDIIARLGGDEFVAALPHVPDSFESVLRDRLEKNISELNRTHDKTFNISCSFGIIRSGRHDTAGLSELMNMADKKLYQEKMAKRRG